MRTGIAVSGKAAAGKDTFVALVIEELATRGLWGVRLGFADVLKEEVLDIYGLTKDMSGGREKLIEYSNALRDEDPFVWIRKFEKRLDSLSPYGLVPVIADLRYENEKEWAEERGFVTVRVDATGMDRATALAMRGEDSALAWSDTPSEVELDEASFDVRLWNPHGSLMVLPSYARDVVDVFDGTVELAA